ncbi:MAG: hypothetical protein A2136_01860 [Chloroflexi bacterium RBG_16_54_11]|nr:MAG: hypothetical protein A2136_01860 [Chloroflexi bacterium RBG_16_54_11]
MLKFFFRTFVIFVFMILPMEALSIPSAMAYVNGPYSPASGTNVGGIGTEAWENPQEITQPGEPYSSALLYHLHLTSNYLQGTQYGFIIPDDVVIVGIEVEINRMSNGRNPGIHDEVVSLVKSSSIVGDNKAGLEDWPITMTVTTYGGPTDLWGTTWSPSEIISPDFGVVLAASRDNNGNSQRYAYVDTLQVTVYYDYATSTVVECGEGSPMTYGDSLVCTATVTRVMGDLTPSGTVTWSSDASSSFDPNPCTLAGADGISNCTTTYTPFEVGSGSHLVTAMYGGDDFFPASSASVLVMVTPRPISVMADPQSKVYSEPDPELTFLITEGSLVFSDTFTGTLNRVPGEGVGIYPILQGTLALSENYILTYVGDNLTISMADPSCEVMGYGVVYDAMPHTATGACSGVLGEPLEGLNLSGTTHTGVGSYMGDPWLFTDVTGNYNDLAGTVDDYISPIAITVAADPQTRFYAHPDPPLTYHVTVGALLPGDAFMGELTREPGEDFGTYVILQGTLALPDNYDLTFVGADLTIAGVRMFLTIVFFYSG